MHIHRKLEEDIREFDLVVGGCEREHELSGWVKGALQLLSNRSK